MRLSDKERSVINSEPFSNISPGASLLVVVRLFVYLWNILRVNTVYWIAHVLLCRYNEREGEHAGRGDAVVEPEDPAVDVDVGHV